MQHLTQFCPPSAASSPALARLLPINPSKSPTARTVKALRRNRILEFISFGSPFNAPCGCRMLFHLAGSLSTALDDRPRLIVALFFDQGTGPFGTIETDGRFGAHGRRTHPKRDAREPRRGARNGN